MTFLLEVKNLHVSYVTPRGQRLKALAGVDARLVAGETLGVLGESGSGKSTLAAALLRMLPPNGRVERGSIEFGGQDLLQCDGREMEGIRGKRLAVIFQEPSQALHPALRVEQQVSDVILAHETLRRRAARDKARQTLAAVFPNDTERIARSYPHQLSGGQRARVLIAQAICCRPELIVADEPTAALDAETQLDILLLFRRLREEFHLSLLWITHNPALLAGFADRVMVLYGGRVAEAGPTREVLFSPSHPYTQGLLRCLPPELHNEEVERRKSLPVIPGEPPQGLSAAGQCVFAPRCGDRIDLCTSREPDLAPVGAGEQEHLASCVKYER
jgi:oligopeptide/dipeptide ABC transporter ATP-binding protein